MKKINVMSATINAVRDYKKLCDDSSNLRKKFRKDHPVATVAIYAAAMVGSYVYFYNLGKMIETGNEIEASAKKMADEMNKAISDSQKSIELAANIGNFSKTNDKVEE